MKFYRSNKKPTHMFSSIFKSSVFRPSYRLVAYGATFLTGFCALSAQVIWSRYMMILTGSEARSINLVIAVFLLGLAGGYYVFGLLSAKNFSRRSLLKYYGYVELLTGLYMGGFPLYFGFLKNLSFRSPPLFIVDLQISFLALLLPTFLMGASIPLLTSVLPKNSKEIPTVHAKIYGWNSLGASLGALLSGFYLIPVFGLRQSLLAVAAINFLSAFFFIGNRLRGPIHKEQEPVSIPSPFPTFFWMVFVFFTGALIISFEVMFIRVLNFSQGAGIYNFPLILSVFIGSLSLGSLSIKRKDISLSSFIKHLFFICFCLQCLFITVPSWLAIIEFLSSINSNYFIYYFLIFLVLTLFLFPVLFYMGKLLPLSYMFLKKTKSDYGKVCGQLYFSNTLGTVFGAVVISHLAFYFLDLDDLFKINIYICFFLLFVVLFYTKNKKFFIPFFLLGVFLTVSPMKWKITKTYKDSRVRPYHPERHFKSLFEPLKQKKPRRRSYNAQFKGQTLFFKDGPNTRVNLVGFSPQDQFVTPKTFRTTLQKLFFYDFGKIESYSLFVNGISDSNSLGDFSTNFLLTIPYLTVSKKQNIKVAVIGLGTGVSSGAYGMLQGVRSVDVLEISPFVIKAIPFAPSPLNFQTMTNKKLHIIETDAFRYFTRKKKKFDIIVSEPSRLWSVGVENLFTKEFYRLIAQSLNKGGIFAQWLQGWDIDLLSMEIVLKTISRIFPHASLYQIGHKSFLILAGAQKLNSFSKNKFNQPFLKKFYKTMGFYRVEDLYLSQTLNSYKISLVTELSQVRENSLYHPLLSERTDKARFLNLHVNASDFSDELLPVQETQKMKAFDNNKHLSVGEWKRRCLPNKGFHFLCSLMRENKSQWNIFKDTGKPASERFRSYVFLRRQGFIPQNQNFMNKALKTLVKEKKGEDLWILLSDFLSEKIKAKDYKGAKELALIFKEKGFIRESKYSHFKKNLELVRKSHQQMESKSPNSF